MKKEQDWRRKEEEDRRKGNRTIKEQEKEEEKDKFKTAKKKNKLGVAYESRCRGKGEDRSPQLRCSIEYGVPSTSAFIYSD